MDFDYDELMDSVSYADDDLDLATDQMDALVSIMKDPLQYIEKTLKIQDKRGNLIPFILNESQIGLYAEITRQEKEGKPVRIIILKPRQIGFSTFVSGWYYQKSATKENTNSAIIAHKNDASTSILDKMKLFYEESPPIFQPMKKACNAKMLLFENPSNNERIKQSDPGLRSKVIIESAVNKNALRSTTVHYLHMSELAFWPYPKETMTSALQAVPNQPDTAVIIESTANGIGGAFYDEWVRAIQGKSEFVPIFYAWFDHSEYQLPVPDDFELAEDEAELKAKYNLTDEQLAWRRWCISANCGGDINQFFQEYPSEWRQAFLASGRPCFDVDKIDIAMREAQPPSFVGRVIDDQGKVKFRTEFNGRLKIWEKPIAKEKYIIGIDTSSGDPAGDPAAMAVYKHSTMTQVAEWHGYMAPDLLGREAVYLAVYYNNAFLIPEANNHGVSCIDMIKRLKYKNIFKRRSLPDIRAEGSTEKYGFWTSEQSKKVLIDNFAKYIRENVNKIKSRDALLECVTYIYDNNEKTHAQVGCHDDLVIANALAVYAGHVKRFNNKPIVQASLKELYHIDSKTGY